MAPNTEAPAEMLMYFPQFKALCAAEDATHNMHNLYTLRDAEVRDPVAWWKTLNEAIELFGDKTEVIFSQHTWPVWQHEHVINYLEKQRDLYKYLHDQTLHLMNQGYTMDEVSNMLILPAPLAQEWFNRGYYGSVSHNAKAIYQRYLGWYDSNPANLNPLMPTDTAKKYVEYMGGAAAVMTKAQEDYQHGNYRWVAQVMNQVVFADPHNKAARYLEADALEQLGYQAENATWRNEYLMGAQELRHGKPTGGISTATPDVLKAMPIPMVLDYMGIRLDAAKSVGKKIIINLNLTDTKEIYELILENSVLIYTLKNQIPHADATLNLTRNTFNKIMLKEDTLAHLIQNGGVHVEGAQSKVTEFMGLFDDFPLMFNIVTPNAIN